MNAVLQRFGTEGLSRFEQMDLFGCIAHSLHTVVNYVFDTVGISIAPACATAFAAQIGRGFSFTTADIVDMFARVKHLSIIDFASAKVLHHKAKHLNAHNTSEQHTAATRLLSLCASRMNACVRSNPLNLKWKRQASFIRTIMRARRADAARAPKKIRSNALHTY